MRKLIFFFYKKLANALTGYRLGEISFLKRIYSLLLSRLRPDFVRVDGNKIYLDPQDSMSLSIRVSNYEGFETELFKRNIKKGDVVLDIGAFIGYYTLIAARLVGEKGRVFAFEPDPTNFSLLKKNIKVNGYKNIVPEQKAVADKNGKIKLYLSKYNKGDHRIYDSYDGRKSIDIEAIKLDTYFKNFRREINFIKLDIQGSEFAALEGMTSLIKKNKNVKIVTEFWPLALKKFGIKPENYLYFLEKLGFKIYNINEEKRRLEEKTIGEIIKICPGKRATNLFCVH